MTVLTHSPDVKLESRWTPRRADETRSFKGAPNLNDPIVANVRDVVNEGCLFARTQRTSPNQASGGTPTGNQTPSMFHWRSSGYGVEDGNDVEEKLEHGNWRAETRCAYVCLYLYFTTETYTSLKLEN